VNAQATKQTARDTERIGVRVRDLRKARRLSQDELAQRLGLSQPQLSLIERGQASLTAENFLRVLRIFNVGIDLFAMTAESDDPLQNALARHGARHLVESEAAVPEHLNEPLEAVWEVLRNPTSARHITALVPVLIANIDRISLKELATRLAQQGRQARLGWLLESLPLAIEEAGSPQQAADQRSARRAVLSAQLVLESALLKPPPASDPVDPLDPDIRTTKSMERVFAEASPEARRWRIATSITASDFADALKAASRAGR
jgi:transcriptional regulator with XRE-family HTH domain